MTDHKYINLNLNILKQFKTAEKRKVMLESKGYTLRSTEINSVTGECTFHYDKEMTK